jgi:hypothetical protein
MPSGPSACESIATPSDLDEEGKIAWEVLKVQLILNLRRWVPHNMLSFPWHFFVVNGGNKPSYFASNYVLYDLPFCLPKL